MRKLSIVIVSYNVKHYLNQCLDSVSRAMDGLDVDVWVVDNNSSDGSVEYLSERYKGDRFHFISNKANLGFSKANNQAIRMSDSEYVLLLNPDTIVGEDVLTNCISFLDSHDDVGGAGLRMLRTDGSFALESRRGVPTPWVSFCKMSGLGSLFPKSRLFGRYYMRYLDESKAEPIEIISGACMFIRRATMDKCGMLDEQFFMYGEDIDLSYRLLMSGSKNYYLPYTILHYKGESTNKTSVRYVNIFYKAMLIFFKKHYGNINVFFSLPIKCAILLKQASAFVIQQVRKYCCKDKTDIEYMQEKTYLLKGGGESLQLMKSLCEKYGLNYSTEGDSSEFDLVVFDVDSTSYRNILEFFRHCGPIRKRPIIATFNRRSMSLITPHYVFE